MATDIAGDAETNPPPPVSGDLDDNGFPVSPIAAATNTFAADFYHSGTDWSSLQAPPHQREESSGMKKAKGGGLLVQRSLFQAWGIEKPPREEAAQGVRAGAGVSSSPSPSGAWSGRKRRWGGSDEEGAVRKPIACPFYKKIPGTPFTVDAFRYGAVEGCSAYFLSHFHHDHYGGLTKKWCHGPIYCTALTARLVKMLLSVDSEYICPLELDTEYVIEEVRVTMLEANHCPGAALIHFRLSDGRTYLHTGDFRASKSMQLHPLLQSGRMNLLYLDTTYCNPKYKFPPQEDVIDFVVRTAQRYLKKQPKTLIVVGAYSIGKENVYLAISQALEVPIYTDASRRRILHLFGWPDLSKRICSCNQSSPLHVLPLASVQHENLKKYLETLNQRFLAVLAFRPTGWTFSEAAGKELDLIKPSSRGRVTIYDCNCWSPDSKADSYVRYSNADLIFHTLVELVNCSESQKGVRPKLDSDWNEKLNPYWKCVPYSEHSSFTELRDFLKFLKPQKVIPTVNVGNATNRDKMQAYFREWLKGL